MTEPGGFLGRWSRRKLEARRPSPEADEAGRADLEGSPAGAEPAVPEALTAEELEALPPIEALTAESDLAPFLRAGIPALLRNAALRRMWSLDPAIRDFVGEARDYSYDWNVPGGVPVSGPLQAGDDVEATLGRLFTRLREEAGPAGPPGSGSRPGAGLPEEGGGSAGGAGPGPASPREEADSAEPPPEEPRPSLIATGPGLGDVAAPSRPEAVALTAEPRPAARARRHGAAIPKFESF